MVDVERMQVSMGQYFAAEKLESLFFVVAGVLAIAASIYLFATASTYRGMGYPLIAVALIQIAVGGAVYLRTDAQVKALGQKLTDTPAAYRAEETARMETVSANFRLYKGIEVALLAIGIALTYLLRRSDLAYAVGIGLIMQASVMLVLDLFAERRADVYVAQLER